MFENLRILYKHYGGAAAIIRSSYFWISIVLTGLSFQSIPNFDWADKTLSVMPSLTGFTIASFAVIFAILGPEMLRKLVVPDGGGHSPIASIAALIGHAVLIQVSAMILSIASRLIDLKPVFNLLEGWILCVGFSPKGLPKVGDWLSIFFSTIGLFSTYYGVLLVLAAVLSIFRMQLLVAKAASSRPGR